MMVSQHILGVTVEDDNNNSVMMVSHHIFGVTVGSDVNNNGIIIVAHNSLFSFPHYWYQILEIVNLYVWRDERIKTII